jgi:type II secretory pathway pseudopilin PulG
MAPAGFRQRRCRPIGGRGFTLFETIIVIGLLAMASVVIAAIQPRVWATQTNFRDQVVGLELMRGCAERLLAVRRNTGYTAVTNTLCNGMGGVGGFAANPTVTLADGANNVLASCSTATCTATILASKTGTPAATLVAITLQLSNY